jgi:Chaperone of endosialidase
VYIKGEIMVVWGSRRGIYVAIVVGALACQASSAAATTPGVENSTPPGAQPSALLSVDQNRNTVIDRVVAQWGTPLEQSGAGLSSVQLRTMLQGLRADHLLAASLAGSLPGLRDVLANSITTPSTATSTRVHIKAVGDVADDLVYTPVSPCRLFDSRPAQGGLGVLNPNVRRTYGATTLVTNQGGPGGCVAPAGAAVALIQIGTLTPAGNGYLQGGPQGVASFPNALILYQPGDQYGTSVAMPLNVTNGRFDVQVQFAATDLYGDLLGYFARPKNYGGTNVITGLDATDAGGAYNTASGDYSTVAGGTAITAGGPYSAVGGGDGNSASGDSSTVVGGSGNSASGIGSTAAGGISNVASGYASFAAGYIAHADADHCVVFGGWSNGIASCSGLEDFMRLGFDHGLEIDYSASNGLGGGTKYVYIGDVIGSKTISVWNGAFLSDAGVWVNASSSKEKKTDFAAVDPADVLSKVALLPITTWRYKEGEGTVRHIGPMAEDFDSAFGVGYGPHTIADLDARGVAFAAIQGLNTLLRQKDAELERQNRALIQQQEELSQLTYELHAIKEKLGL